MPHQRRIGPTRRTFLKDAALLAALPLGLRAFGATRFPWLQDKETPSPPAGSKLTLDEEIAIHKFRLATNRALSGEPIGDVMTVLGTSFIGTPYVAHTLEVPGPEQLVVNLHGLDCTTFVENVLALARCVKLNEKSFDALKKQLQLIRYRSGVIEGYPSRLHYFTDWIGDNERKHVVRDITGELGGVPLVKQFDFMSNHVKSYPQLSDASALEAIRAAEVRLSAAAHAYVPRAKIGRMQDKLRNGDIIAITTSIPGLDVSHTGLVSYQDGAPHYLHAPLSGGAVQLSQGTLAEYLAGAGKQTGIIVARPMEPGER